MPSETFTNAFAPMMYRHTLPFCLLHSLGLCFVLRLVLRIATDDSKAVCRLSVKFGAPLKACRGLLEKAKELGLDVVGVSFHVGSGCTDPVTYTQAISDARCVFDMGVSGERIAGATLMLVFTRQMMFILFYGLLG